MQTSTAPTQNAALEAWQAILSRHPRLAGFLNILTSVVSFFLNGHAVVALVRWMVTVAGRIAESALLLAVLYVTLNNVAHTLLIWLLPPKGIELGNYLSVVAFSILPELIVGIAITTTYNHWKLFFRAPAWKNGAWVWAMLYTLPTSVFTVMTITTLSSFVQSVAASGDPGQATGAALTVRFLAGWSYSLIEILFVTIGKKSYAERFDALRATEVEQRQELSSAQQTIATRDKEITALRATEQELRATLQRATTECENLRAMSATLRQELSSALQTIATRDKEITALRATVATQGADIEVLRATETTQEQALSTLCESMQAQEHTITSQRVALAQQEEECTQLRATVARWQKQRALRPVTLSPMRSATPIPESATVGATASATQSDPQGYVAIDDGDSIAISNGQGATVIATGEPRQRIKQAMLVALQQGEKINYKEIAEVAQAGYSTVRKHAAAIIEEISQEVPAMRLAQESLEGGK